MPSPTQGRFITYLATTDEADPSVGSLWLDVGHLLQKVPFGPETWSLVFQGWPRVDDLSNTVGNRDHFGVHSWKEK